MAATDTQAAETDRGMDMSAHTPEVDTQEDTQVANQQDWAEAGSPAARCS